MLMLMLEGMLQRAHDVLVGLGAGGARAKAPLLLLLFLTLLPCLGRLSRRLAMAVASRSIRPVEQQLVHGHRVAAEGGQMQRGALVLPREGLADDGGGGHSRAHTQLH